MEPITTPGPESPAQADGGREALVDLAARNKRALPLLIESTTDYGIFMLDPKGVVATWNAGAERIMGYTPGEIIGKHFSTFYPPEALAKNWPATELERAARDGRIEDEGWRVRKDGTRFWANVVITALRDEDGRLLGFGKVSRDLSDRKRAEQELRDSEERFRLIVDHTLDYGMFMLNPDGVIASWNTGAQRIKGYTAEEAIGQHFSIFYTQEAKDRRWPQYELKEAARVGRFEDEGWRVRKDGSQFWANVVITALRGPDGELRGFSKVTRDVSERKAAMERIEALTRELQKRVTELAATYRELMQKTSENQSFVYSVSHDLRAPLVNLQGFSQELALSQQELEKLLSDERVPDDIRQRARQLITGDMAESVGFIRNSVQHLGNIVDGLLRLSRVGRVEYRLELVDTSAVVADILASLHTTIQESGAKVRVEPLPAVRADRNAIGQIFANLIGNALKSFDPGRPGLVEISASSAQPPVFAVKDNGVGIAADHRSKIFQVFQHVHPERGAGEGMGLAIVRRIVERHNGRIWFESTPAVGTTFYFSLGADPGAVAGDVEGAEG
jgi:PAS domain S-box-containing protein